MPDQSQARVHVANRAFLKIGMPASYSSEGEFGESGTVDLLWDGVAAEVTAAYDFSDFRKTFSLEKLAGTPGNSWAFGFRLPSERIGEPLAILDRVAPVEHYLREFMIEAGCVYTNIDPVWARCRVMQDPQYWDQGITEGFATALAAAFAIPFKQDEDLQAQKREEAFGAPREMYGGGIFGRLIALNRAAQPQGRRFMDDDPLTSARWG